MKKALYLALSATLAALSAPVLTADTPTTASPVPSEPSEDVISLFSSAYTDVTVDTFRTSWSNAAYEQVTIEGVPTIRYTDLDFVGIETVASQIDATGMDYFHIDLWTPNMDEIRVKLVDFGPDGTFGGGDDTEHELAFTGLAQGEWHSLQIPLADFTGMQNQANLAQFILSGTPTGASTLYVDNIYLSSGGSNGGGNGGTPDPTQPATASPVPTEPSANVVSLFSSVYSDVPVDTFRTSWSAADLNEVMIEGVPTLRYSNLDFVGIETVASQIDATDLQYFHIDVWTPNMDVIRVKLVDFGPDGAFGGGDDTEYEIVFDTLAKGQWHSLQIPLSDFTGMQNQANLAQFILSGTPVGAGTLYVDNIYLSGTGEVSTPGTHFAGILIDKHGNIDTGDFLGFIHVSRAPWVYVFSLNRWVYMVDPGEDALGAWTHFLRPDETPLP